MRKRAIITGATGVIGMALIDELMRENWDITVIIRPKSPKKVNITQKYQNINVVELDVSQLNQLSKKQMGSYDVFFHLAWVGTFDKERQDMELQYRNIGYTLDAVRAADQLECGVFVGIGSQAEFGHSEEKLQGDLFCYPDTAYGAAKLSACHMSRVLCGKLGIRYEWCRILSVFGKYDREQTLIMSAVKSFLNNKYFECTKGEQVWDYLYSRDAALALRLVAEEGVDGRCYCLGSGQTRLLRDYISCIRDNISPDAKIGFGKIPYYPNQAMYLEADIRPLQEDTGFNCRYTFEEGIEELVDWLKANQKY